MPGSSESGGTRVVVLVGPGNNGADALYAGAHLADDGAAALRCRARLAACTTAAPPRCGGRRGRRCVGPDGDWAAPLAEADLVLDGILGIGGRAGLPDEAVGGWVDAIPDDAYVVAVDLPSGQDPMAGEVDPATAASSPTRPSRSGSPSRCTCCPPPSPPSGG